MSSTIEAIGSEINRPGWIIRTARSRLFDLLASFSHGSVTVNDALGRNVLGDSHAREGLHVNLTIHDMDFYSRVAINGSVGAGEAYMDELWDCDDLVGLVRLLVLNRDLLDAMEGGLSRLGGWLMKATHAFRKNTKAGSRKNISEHYDLGNQLFGLFLDENLMYSSALFASPSDTLETASQRKLDTICQKLELNSSDHLIEIGTGWGGMALHAAKNYGCQVTTTTISKEQHALASQRVQAAGLSDKVTVLLEDYRDLTGSYDKLVSIEMIEAVGHQFLDTYLNKCASLLKSDGLGLIQAITIEDYRYQQALRSVDFIRRYIFPGSFIPSISAISASMAKTDLRLIEQNDFAMSYAQTLHIWRKRFMARLDEVIALGYSRRFTRMWEFYLAYCEGGFIERSIGVSHLLLAKPMNRGKAWIANR